MLDHFLPKESGVTEGPSDREQSKSKIDPTQTNKNRFENGPAAPSGLWPSNVAVTTVRWNSCCGLGYAPFLLSGTASGIVRIDFLEGAWIRSAIPYGSIEKIRGEGEEDTGDESMSQSDSE
jgi:transcription factor C subunit 6